MTGIRNFVAALLILAFPALASAQAACPRGTTYQDGCSLAASGAPQQPDLLNGYAARAPWNVAGVDYAVGIQPGTVLKNPATAALPPNVTRDVGQHWFVVNGNTTVDGWNFSGWQVLVYGGTNVTISNSDFTGGLLIFRDDGNSSGAIIRYNKFDRQNQNSIYAAPIELYKGGDFIVEYNQFLNSYGEFIQIPTNATKSVTIRYNLMMNAGGGASQGAHGDWVQFFGTATIPSLVIEYNTAVQNISSYATQGFSIQNNPTVQSGRISNNTMIAKSNMNYFITAGKYWFSDTFYIRDNYVDPTFPVFGFIDFGLTPGSYSGNQVVQSGNTNMLDGTQPSGWNNTASPPVPTVSISANPTSVSSGGSSTLTWSSTYATGCTAGGGWSGSKATSGTQALTNLTTTATYSLACTGAGGSGNNSATVTVTGGGSACPRGTGYPDGCAGAAVTAGQFPSLLNGYAARAPWNVAGVDYAVGINAGVTLKNPATGTLPSGVSRDVPGKRFTVSGAGVTLNGWDFSGGWVVSVTGNNAIVTNNNFTNSWLRFEPGTSGGTVSYNVFDQGGMPASQPDYTIINPLIYFGSGTVTVTYNYFANTVAEHLQFPVQSSVTPVIKYNLFYNSGRGAQYGAHGDWVQTFGGTLNNVVLDYNTSVQNLSGSVAATQGWSLQGSASSPTINGGSISNNTEVVASNANVNIINLLQRGLINGTVAVKNNFVEKPSSTRFIGADVINGGGTGAGIIDSCANLNMVTGGVLTDVDAGPATCGGTPAPTATLSANPASITTGQSSTLTWGSTNATSCAGTGFAAGGVSGSASVSPSITTPYSVTCTGAGGTSPAATATVTVAAAGGSVTIGETAILPNADNGNGNLLVAQNVSLPQAATIQSLSFYVTTPGGSLRLGVYDATGPNGGPGALKAQTGSFIPAEGWNTRPVAAQVLLQPGTYWLAYLPSSNTLAFRKNVTAGISGKYYSQAFGTLPATYSTNPSTTPSHWSFYATLAAPVAPTAPTASISVSPTSVPVGDEATITWSSADAASCTGTNFTPTGTNGSLVVRPYKTTTYSIVCTGTGGASPAESATLTVVCGQ